MVEQACFTASVRLSASFGSAAVASAEVFFSFFVFPLSQVREVVEEACFTATVRLSASFGSAAVATAEVFFLFFI